MPIYFIHSDGTAEEIDENCGDDTEIDISPELWIGCGIEAGKCKDFSGKFMFPEANKDLN